MGNESASLSWTNGIKMNSNMTLVRSGVLYFRVYNCKTLSLEKWLRANSGRDFVFLIK